MKKIVALIAALLAALAAPCAAQGPVAAILPAPARAQAIVYVAQIPPDSVPPEYARWYAWAEHCTGLKGDYAKVRWYVTPAPWSDGLHKGPTFGMWQKGHRITINYPEHMDSTLVIHESIHDLSSYYADLYPDSIPHPKALYNGVCATEFHTPK